MMVTTTTTKPVTKSTIIVIIGATAIFTAFVLTFVPWMAQQGRNHHRDEHALSSRVEQSQQNSNVDFCPPTASATTSKIDANVNNIDDQAGVFLRDEDLAYVNRYLDQSHRTDYVLPRLLITPFTKDTLQRCKDIASCSKGPECDGLSSIHDKNCCVHYLHDMLLRFDKMAKEHQISYYITAGGLLGAVRNKTLIPWTADHDIITDMASFVVNLVAKGDAGNTVMHQYGLHIGFHEMPRVCLLRDKNEAGGEEMTLRRLYDGAYMDLQPFHDFVGRIGEATPSTPSATGPRRVGVISHGTPHQERLRDIDPQGVTIYDRKYPAPTNAHELLVTYYGSDYMTPDSSRSGTYYDWERS